ncbi:DNA repair protein RecO [Prauserella alba]|uniref:DNA repair protein RecO n=1 Tax=Prauserella alba TaxID=176898 RepID=A0ABP4FUV1_9PSEU|nr:DNA repair protein RecO [Prauserella alba]MCP2179675.1 DNA replication and repair protein RecO [Prauserella alba]
MSLYRDTGVVLRVHKLGEADRIITLLTRRNGKVRAVAKGVRRTTSRFGARLEPFGHVDVQFYTGRTLDVVTQVQTVDAFALPIVGDYQAYTAAAAIVETADRLAAEEEQPALKLYLLVVGALRALAGGQRDSSLVLDAFLLRAMAFAGWEPALTECARCGERGPHAAFNVQAGGLLCPRCRIPGSVHPAPEVLAVMAALLHGDWPLAEDSTQYVRRDVSGLVAAHLQWHLERRLRSLPFVERRAREAPLTAALGSDAQAGGDIDDETGDPGADDTDADGEPHATAGGATPGTAAWTDTARATAPGEVEVTGAAEGSRRDTHPGAAGT